MAFMAIKRLIPTGITQLLREIVLELTRVVFLASYRVSQLRIRLQKNLRWLLNLLINSSKHRNIIKAPIYFSMLMT